MYHTIRFTVAFLADVEVSPEHPLERVRIQKGDCLQAQVKPYVMESGSVPVEVADLFFDDGTATRRVPFSWFTFVE